MEHQSLTRRRNPFAAGRALVTKRAGLALHYRFDHLASLVLSFVQLLAYRALWIAVYRSGVGDKSVPLDLLITYIIVGNIIADALAISLWEDFSWRLKEGSVVADLTRPIDFEKLVFFQTLGDTWGRVLTRLLPKFAVAWLLFRVHVPSAPLRWMAFFVALVLGYLLLFCLNFLVAASAFVFTENWGIEAVKSLLVLIFSGIYIPLWLYPEWLQPFVNLAPFRGYLSIPMSIYIGRTPLSEVPQELAFQLIWTIILYSLGRIAIRVSLGRAVIYGG